MLDDLVYQGVCGGGMYVCVHASIPLFMFFGEDGHSSSCRDFSIEWGDRARHRIRAWAAAELDSRSLYWVGGYVFPIEQGRGVQYARRQISGAWFRSTDLWVMSPTR